MIAFLARGFPRRPGGTARGGWTFLACGGLGGTAYKVRRECGRACRPSSTDRNNHRASTLVLAISLACSLATAPRPAKRGSSPR